MKALSVRQPWAWLIINAAKDIENRSWFSGYMGGLWIHASKGCTRKEYADAIEFCDELDLPMPPALTELERGCVIGSVQVIGCVQYSTSPWFVGPYGLVLSRPNPVEPFEYKGRLGFFEIELPEEKGSHHGF